MIRGKDVLPRVGIEGMLLDLNHDMDGPWEPAIFVSAEALTRVRNIPSPAVRRSARVGHDNAGTHDIHLPGDGAPFDLDAVVAKLLIAEVLAEEP
jgi:hypothetical protein